MQIVARQTLILIKWTIIPLTIYNIYIIIMSLSKRQLPKIEPPAKSLLTSSEIEIGKHRMKQQNATECSILKLNDLCPTVKVKDENEVSRTGESCLDRADLQSWRGKRSLDRRGIFSSLESRVRLVEKTSRRGEVDKFTISRYS